MQLGQDPEIVYEIVRGLSRIINKPLIVKLTPNTSNLGDIARASIRGKSIWYFWNKYSRTWILGSRRASCFK